MTRSFLISEDFTPIFERFAQEPLSFTEAEALRETFWDLGEPARLREDIRFRETPFGRWMRADRWLANDRLYKAFAEQGWAEVDLQESLAAIPARLPLVFCLGDPRFILQGGRIKLSEAGRRGLPRPKHLRRLDPDALEGRRATLRRRIEERWEIVREPRPPTEPDEEALSPCALVLDDDGLHIVVPPISEEAIPPFVRELILEVHPQPIRLRVSSLRHGHEEVIPFSTEPYRWSAPGPEAEILAVVLQNLTVKGLAAAEVTVFQEDENGRAWRGALPRVSPGQRVRVLFPPDVKVPEGIETTPAGLWADVWRAWSLDLPDPIPSDLAEVLARLGILVGEPVPGLTWRASVPPSAWTMACGRPAPVFDERDAPVLDISGLKVEAIGDAALLIVGADVHQEVMLPEGSSWHVEIGELVAGRYVAELIPRSKAVSRSASYFEVRKDAGSLPAARALINPWGDIHLPVDEEDLAHVDLDHTEIVGPPFWPAEVEWEGLDNLPLTRFQVGRDGSIQGAFASLARTVRDAIHGHLIVRFGEMGAFHLYHFQAVEPEEFIRRLEQVVGEAWPAAIPFNYARAERLWLAPICKHLGYRLAAMPDVESGPEALIWRLLRLEQEDRRYRLMVAGLLILVKPETDFSERKPGSAWVHAHRACQETGLRTAIVTDGLRWRRFSRKSIPDPPMELKKAVGDSELASWFRRSLGAEAP